MNHVLYYSMTGNTKKMATAMAGELGVEAKNIKTETGIPPGGLLFLGSGSYGDKPGEEMAKLIANNDFSGRKVALFSTSNSGAGKEIDVMADALNRKGAAVTGKYTCKGKFLFMNRGRPGKADLEAAKQFARETVKNG